MARAGRGKLPPHPADLQIIPFNSSLGNTIVRAGESIESRTPPEESQYPPEWRRWRKKMAREATIALPIEVEGRMVGLLIVVADEQEQLAGQEIRTLQAVTEGLGPLLENARLQAELSQELQETEQRQKRLDVVARGLFDASISADENLLKRILQIVIGATSTDNASFYEYDEASQFLSIKQTAVPIPGLTEENQQRLTFRYGEEKGLVGLVATTRESLYVPDASLEPRWITVVKVHQSSYFVPIVYRQRLLGVMRIGSGVVDGISSEGRAIADAIAAYVASTMENARLNAQEKLRIEEMETLYSVSTTLEEPGSFTEKTARALEELVRRFKMELATFVWVSPNDNELEPVASVGPFAQHVPAQRQRWVSGITQEAVQRAEVIVSNDYAANPVAWTIAVKYGIRSAAAIPVIKDGTAIGAINLLSRELGYFNEERVRSLSKIAGEMGVSLENARLEEEERLRAQEMDTLYAVSAALGQPGTFEEKATWALEELSKRFDLHLTVFRTVDLEKRESRLVAQAGKFSNHVWQQDSSKSRRSGIARDAMLNRKVVIANEYASRPDADEDSLKLGIQSAMVLPIVQSDVVRGIIFVSTTLPLHFTPDRVRVLTKIGEELGSLLENAELEAEARIHAEELDALYSVSAAFREMGTLEEKASKALDEIVKHFEVQMAVFRVIGSEGAGNRQIASAGRLAPRLDSVSTPGGIGIGREAIRTKEIIVSNDYSSDPRAPVGTLEMGIQSALALPIVKDGTTIGVIFIASTELDHFTPHRVRSLGKIADELGTLLDNARLEAEERLRVEELDALYSVSSILAQSTSFEKTIKLVMEQLVERFDL